MRPRRLPEACQSGQVLKIPIAHADGNYYTDPVTLAAMQANAQIVLRYCTPEGKVTPEANPNGSLDNIAGIINAGRQCAGDDAASGALCRRDLGE